MALRCNQNVVMKYFIAFISLAICAIAAPSNSTGRIVNGQDAAEGQFPYHVSLRYGGEHWCGASILDNVTLLTAAHCIDDFDFSKFTVRLGRVSLSEQTEEYKISTASWHAGYNKENYPYELTNDVAILKLEVPIIFREGVQPIKLRQTDIDEEDVVLAGWGTTSYLGETPDKLQFANLKTLTTEHCQARHDTWEIIDTVLCAYGGHDHGPCHGDSGSALVDHNGEQVGIVSWAVLPCGSGVPEVYTRIYSFLDWITENRD